MAGRKIGILVTDGTAAMLTAVRSATAAAKVNVELVAPTVGGIEASDGTRLPAGQKIDGGPSVLYDAVIIAPSAHGALALASDPAARDFATDAYAHCKFIGHTADAMPLLEASGLAALIDDGFVSLDSHSAAEFIGQCSQLRYWARQQAGVPS